jgi:hypothetical protein
MQHNAVLPKAREVYIANSAVSPRARSAVQSSFSGFVRFRSCWDTEGFGQHRSAVLRSGTAHCARLAFARPNFLLLTVLFDQKASDKTSGIWNAIGDVKSRVPVNRHYCSPPPLLMSPCVLRWLACRATPTDRLPHPTMSQRRVGGSNCRPNSIRCR